MGRLFDTPPFNTQLKPAHHFREREMEHEKLFLETV